MILMGELGWYASKFLYNYTQWNTLSSGNAVLRSALALEVMGGWEDTSAHDGSGRWSLHWNWEENEEETDSWLPVGELAVSQLVGLPILPVRGARPY